MLVPLTISRSESNFSNALAITDSNDNIHGANNWMPVYEDMKGLSNEDAKKAFLAELNPILEEHTRILKSEESGIWGIIKVIRWDYISLSSIVATVACIVAFLIMGVVTFTSKWDRNAGIPIIVPFAIVESTVLLVFIVIDTLIRVREEYHMRTSLIDRIKTVLIEFEKHGIQNVQEIRIPHSPSISCVRVLRSEKLTVLPTNLLVEGDIVELAYGEIAPCKMRFIHPINMGKASSETSISPISHTLAASKHAKHKRDLSESSTPRSRKDFIPLKSVPSSSNQNFNQNATKSQLVMERNQFLSPSLLLTIFSNWSHIPANQGRFRFELLETPFSKYVLEKLLSKKRPKSVLSEQADILRRIGRWAKLIILVLALLANGILLAIYPYPNFNGDSSKSFIYYLAHLLYYPFFVIVPFIPLNVEFMLQILRVYGDARTNVLFDALKREKTPYTNYDDSEDEFDVEAGPPTKFLSLPFHAVMKKIITLVFKGDRLSVTRTKNIFESLASTSVICYVDKEGTLGSPFPIAEKIVTLGNRGEIQTLDLNHDSSFLNSYKFTDDVEPLITSLKPIGLNCVLNTHCGALNGRKRKEAHRKLTNLQLYGKSIPSRQTCTCMIGREIGFTEFATNNFTPWREIYTFAPTHPSVHEIYHYYSNLEVPSLLSLILRDKRDEKFHSLSEGSLELVLDASTEYWNGETVVLFTESCVAYSYRPILPRESEYLYLNERPPGRQIPNVFVEIPPNPETFNVTVSPLMTPAVESAASRFRKTHHRSRAESLQSLIKLPKSMIRHEIPSHNHFGTTYEDLIPGQVFLGMSTFFHQPKLDVVEFVEDLASGGIRFVYFSRLGERESKAFAERLGVETDWNSCILLSNPDDGNGISGGYIEPSDIKARLPRGIDAIKHHLRDVDDIPLHVSLFAESTADSVQQMIQIFQEYGKVVCCVGSALQMANTLLFATADVGVAVEPLFSRPAGAAANMNIPNTSAAATPINSYTNSNAKDNTTYVSTEYSTNAISASLTSIASALFMQFETSPYVLTDVIRESRSLMQNGIQMLVFLIGVNFGLSVGNLVSMFLLLPPLLSVLHVIAVMYFISPILVLPLLFSPYDANIMTLMPVKNIEHLSGLSRFLMYLILRFVPNIIVCIALFFLCLKENVASKDWYIAKTLIESDWIFNSATEKTPIKIFHAQTMAMNAFVFFAVVSSVTFLHRHIPFWSFRLSKNIYYCASIVIVIVIQVLFWLVSQIIAGNRVSWKTPISYYIISVTWAIIGLFLQEAVKFHDLKHFTRFQKRSKLEFNTKLGMHSPV